MLIFRNFWIKIASIFLACCFWVFLVTFENVIYDFPQPLEIEVVNKKAGFSIPEVLPNVHVQIASPKDEAAFLRPDDFKVYIDMTGLTKGEYLLDVKVVSNQEKVNVISYSPSQVKVHVEDEVSKVFKVESILTGRPKKGYEISAPIFTPTELYITGASSNVAKVKKVAFTIELQGDEDETVRGVYDIKPYSQNDQDLSDLLNVKPNEVELQMAVTKEEEEKKDADNLLLYDQAITEKQ